MPRVSRLTISLAVIASVVGCGSSMHQRTSFSRAAGSGQSGMSAPALPSNNGSAAATAKQRPHEPVPSPGLERNVSEVVFVGAATGLAIESDVNTGPGTIQRTTNAGRSWRTVWRRRDIVLYSIAADGSSVIASGARIVATRAGYDDVIPVLVRSDDGGKSWSVTRPVVPTAEAQQWFVFRVRLVSRSLAFMVLNADIYNPALPGVFAGGLLRSTDGGLQWTAVRLPGHGYETGGLAFVGPERGFATGFVSGGCAGEIWTTANAGASWRAVPRTCVKYGLDSLSFPNARVGYAAADPTESARGHAGRRGVPATLALLRTSDGGARWSRSLVPAGAAGIPPPVGGFAEIEFSDPLHGYALAGGCPAGARGLCGGELWVSNDSGRSWRDTGHRGTGLDLAGPRDVWITEAPGEVSASPATMDAVGDILWNTTDGGRSWRALASATVPAKRSPPSAHGRPGPPCRPRVSYVGSGQATGNVFALFEFRNDTRRYCSVSRFPRIQLFRPDGHPLSSAQYADPSNISQSKPVNGLGAGKTGAFNLIFRPLNGSGTHRCSPAAAYAQIKISSLPPARIALPTTTPPSSTPPIHVRLPINPCYRFEVIPITQTP